MAKTETFDGGHYEKDGIPIKGRTYFILDTIKKAKAS